MYGSPGRSLALEMAARLGLSPSVIAAARQNLTARDAQMAEHLAKIDRDMRALDHERRLVTREREELRATDSRLRQREDSLRQREESSRKRLNEAVEAEVRQARKEIDEIIGALKQKTERIAQGAGRLVTTGETGQVRSDARAAVEAVAKQHADAAGDTAPASTPNRPALVGDRVTVGALALEGTVTAIQGHSLEVDVRGKRMRATCARLRIDVIEVLDSRRNHPPRIPEPYEPDHVLHGAPGRIYVRSQAALTTL